MDFLLNNILTLVAAHIVLISAVLKNEIDTSETPSSLDAIYDSNLVVVCRFIGSIILQMAVLPKLNQGMQTLKYALNHPWHFKSLWLSTFISTL